MRLSHPAWLLSSLLVAAAAMGASCFPPVEFFGSGGSAGAGGGATSSSSSSDSSAVSTGSSDASSANSSSGGPCMADEDGDRLISSECTGGTDCADQDKEAFPGATVFHPEAIKGKRSGATQPFDFNCDTVQEPETPTLNCGLTSCAEKGKFLQDTPCGQMGTLGHCTLLGTLCSPVSDNTTKIQFCR